jgi:t-SNARE complex subunit (syntaxin)
MWPADHIEVNIENAHSNVEEGHGELVQARKYQKAAQKKIICLVCICAIAAMVLGIVLWKTIG